MTQTSSKQIHTGGVTTNHSKRPKKERKFDFEIISFWIIAIMVLLVPLFFVPSPILGLDQTKLLLISVGTFLALIFFVVGKMKEGVVRPGVNSISLFALLIPGIYFVSSWFGINRHKSYIGSLTEIDTFFVVGLLFVLMVLTGAITNTPKRRKIILSMFFVSTGIAMVSQVVRIVVGHKLFGFGILDLPTNTLVGGWGDMTMISLYFLAGLLVILSMSKLKKWVAVMCTFFTLVPFFFVVLSRLSFDLYVVTVGLVFIVALLSAVLFSYLFTQKYTQKHTKDIDDVSMPKQEGVRIFPSLFVMGVAIILVLFVSPLNNSYLASITKVTYVEGRPNWQSTFDIGAHTLSERLLLGSGPNTFDAEWNLHHTKEINNYIFWNYEYNFGVGFVPTSIVTVGLIGFVSWILFTIIVCVGAVKVIIRSKKSSTASYYDVAIAVVSIGTSLTLVVYSPGIVVVFLNMMFVGMLTSILYPSHQGYYKTIQMREKWWSHFVITIVCIGIIVGSLFALSVVGSKSVAQMYYRKAITAPTIDGALVMIQTALRFDSSQSLYYNTIAQLYASKVEELVSLSSGDLNDRKSEINDTIIRAVNYAVLAEQLDPTDFKSKMMTGRILELFGSLGLKDAGQSAVKKYLSASDQIPANPLPLLFASNASVSIDDISNAKIYLEKAIGLKSEYSNEPELGQDIQGIIERINARGAKPVEKATTTKAKK